MSCCQNKGGCQGKNLQNESSVDMLVCTCMGVMESEIVEAIKAGAETFEALSEKLGVGTGCSSCVAQVNDILREELSKRCCKS